MNITKNLKFTNQVRQLTVLVVFVLMGCMPKADGITTQNTVEPSASTTSFSPTKTPDLWRYASLVVDGICFEAAQQYAGRLYVIRNIEQLSQFYNQVDSSQLCRHAITQYPFTFDNGQVLAGMWSAGNGCTALHEIVQFVRNDATRKITIVLRFTTEGQCDYELVRPFWMAIDRAQDYQIDIEVIS